MTTTRQITAVMATVLATYVAGFVFLSMLPVMFR